MLLSPLGLNLTASHTHSHRIINYVYIEMYLKSTLPPPFTPLKISNSKVSKMSSLPAGQTLGEQYTVYPIIVPDR